MLKLYTLAPEPHELTLPDMSSLDAISRQLPDGLYSTLRTYAERTRVLGLQAHLDRLYHPPQGRGDPLTRPYIPSAQPAELRAALRETLASFGAGEARVRILLSTSEAAGEIFLAIEPLKAPDELVYRRGVRAALSSVERPNPRLKTSAFIGNSDVERKSIARSGMYEALMVRDGRLFEGLTSNFYAVKAGKIITARDGILLGVTRRYVLRLARSHGIGIEYRPLRVDELGSLDEAFITSSGRGVVPVTEIEGQPVGAGQVGEISKLLRRVYDEYVLRKAELV